MPEVRSGSRTQHLQGLESLSQPASEEPGLHAVKRKAPGLCNSFPKLQSLRVELNSSRVVLDDFFSTLSALSQLQTLALGVFGASLGARELSQLPGSIRQLILSHASVSTEGLIQLPSLAQLRELDVRDCNGSPHQQGLLDVLPELKSLEVRLASSDVLCKEHAQSVLFFTREPALVLHDSACISNSAPV